VTGSPSSDSAVARADPISRGSVHEIPLSSDRPTPANASKNDALLLAIRKSHANANPAPAPAATPLTAATTGLGMAASPDVIGL
jgi:hypothetical protein